MDRDITITQQVSDLQAERDHLLLAYRAQVQRSDFLAGFLARTAHELRSPLSSAIGLHQMILNDLCDDPEEERDCVHEANRSTLRLVELLDRLIEASKLAQGAIAPEIQPVIVADLLDEVRRLVQLQAANRNFRFTVDLPDRDLWAIGDPKRLVQALIGAIDATIRQLATLADGGDLALTASATDATVEIWFDSSCPPEAWQEAIDLMAAAPGADPTAILNPLKSFSPGDRPKAELRTADDRAPLSPTLSLWVAQMLLESMAGSLALATFPETEAPPTEPGLSATPRFRSRLCFTLPLDLD